MSHRSPQKRSPAEWQALIDAQAASGRSQADFCTLEGLSQTTFQHWKRRLKRGTVTPNAQTTSPELFAPLMDVPVTGATESAPGWTVELDLGAGICLRIRRGGS